MRLILVCSIILLSTTALAIETKTPDAAKRLAQDAIIVDTHIDAPTELLKHWEDLGLAVPSREFDYPKSRAGGLDVAFMSIYTSPGQDQNGTAWSVANQMIDGVEALVQRHPDKFAILTSPRDIKRLGKNNRVLLPLGMENGAPIGDDLAKLQFFFDRGVRYITLAHGANNRICDSSYAATRQWNGVSPFGEKVIAEMNRLGIMIDVSHISDAAMLRTLELSRVPVVATHSGLRHFTPGFERNVSDELLKQIAAKGGVVQIPFGNAFVNPESAAETLAYFRAANELNKRNEVLKAAGKPLESEEAFDKAWEASHPPLETHIDAVLNQIDYGVKLVGIDHIGIGSDFDGVSGALPVELKTAADYPNLVAGLQARAYGDADIRKILGGNLLRVWRAVEAGSSKAP